MITLVSFYGDVAGHDSYWAERQRLLHLTARKFGAVDNTIAWNHEDLHRSRLYAQHQSLFDEPRGCGFWAWKPWVILRSLDLVPKDTYVIYHDIGKAFRDGDRTRGGDPRQGYVIEGPVTPMVHWAEAHDGIFPGVNVPHYGPASQWTRRDCFVAMDCDSEDFWSKPLVQAGYTAWKNTPASRQFLKTWLGYCLDRRVVSDDSNVLGESNLDDFRDHRHDQSILSNLVRREGLSAFGDIKQSKAYYRNFNFLVRRVAQDIARGAGQPPLSRDSGIGQAGLPGAVVNWLELNLWPRTEAPRILFLESGHSRGYAALRQALPTASTETIDLGFPVGDTDRELPRCPPEALGKFDWVIAWGFRDQSILCEVTQAWAAALRPMGLMIGGLDTRQKPGRESTLTHFLDRLGDTRVLDSMTTDGPRPISLVLGNAVNPMILARSGGRPAYFALQRGPCKAAGQPGLVGILKQYGDRP